MKVLQFPLTKISLFFVFGILMSYYFPTNLFFSSILLIFSFIVFVISYFKDKSKMIKNYFFGISVLILSFCIGWATLVFKNNLNQKDNYYNQKNNLSEVVLIELTLREKLKPTKYHDKFVADMQQLNESKCSGKILVNIDKDSTSKQLLIGQKIQVKTKIIAHKPPNNPDQFDYGKYLNNKSIFAQIEIYKSEIKVGGFDKNLYYYAAIFRTKIIESLQKYNFNDKELQVVNALILGQQQDINSEILQDYQFAGAVHVLSVSGLHVGYILLFLNFLLSYLPKKKVFNYTKFFIIIASLWGFALIAGLSPSVVRSATMFSFVAAGQCWQRETNIFHTLLASLLFILLIEPTFLFDVGFQLSYISLFFIIWMQPVFTNFYNPRNKIKQYFWEILTVSVAAQIGAFPLSIYYFHQFPGLFFITNLIILPALGLIMAWGLLVMLLAYLDLFAQYPILVLQKMIYYLNFVIHKIASIESLVFTNIPLNKWMLFWIYFIIIWSIIWIKKPTYGKLIYAMLGIIGLQIFVLNNNYNIEKTNQLLVMQSSKKTILVERNGTKASIIANVSILKKIKNNKMLQQYLTANFMQINNKEQLTNVLFFKNKKILVLDSLLILPKNISPEIVLLTQSPKLNLNRLIDLYQPKSIVADGSNYKTYLQIWKATCLKRKIHFHATAENGFYEIK